MFNNNQSKFKFKQPTFGIKNITKQSNLDSFLNKQVIETQSNTKTNYDVFEGANSTSSYFQKPNDKLLSDLKLHYQKPIASM